MDVVGAEVHFSEVISPVETVAAGSGPRSEGVAAACVAGDCRGEVVALPIPEDVEKRVQEIANRRPSQAP